MPARKERRLLVRIGTSGCTYKHWRGKLYPEGLAQKKWLEFYSRRFSTVELNASFYHIPKSSVARGWKERTGEGFRFAVKVSRLITYVHRLKDCGEAVSWFFREMEPLNEKVLAYLLQFPPYFSP